MISSRLTQVYFMRNGVSISKHCYINRYFKLIKKVLFLSAQFYQIYLLVNLKKKQKNKVLAFKEQYNITPGLAVIIVGEKSSF